MFFKKISGDLCVFFLKVFSYSLSTTNMKQNVLNVELSLEIYLLPVFFH